LKHLWGVELLEDEKAEELEDISALAQVEEGLED
jgi:hypothetical protein